MNTVFKPLFWVLLCFSSICHTPVQSQVILYSNTTNYTFKYHTGNLQSSPQISKTIIDAIAAGNNKMPSLVNYSISFDQKIDLGLVNNFMQININNKMIQASGDVTYRGFFIGDMLMPSTINILLNIVDERGNPLRSFQLSNLNKANGYATTINTNMVPVGSQRLAVQVVNMMLFYDQQTVTDFNYRVGIINDYYNSSMVLDNAQVKLSSIVFVSPDNIEGTTQILQQVENDINLIETRNYTTSLQLTAYDPINLLGRTAALRNVLAQKRLSVNMAYSALDSYFYTKGLEALAAKNNSQAQIMFHKSLAINPAFAPSAYQLANLKFEEDNLVEADLKLRELWFSMNPDPTMYQNALNLFKNISIGYIEKGEELTKKGQINEALSYYDKAQRICREINGVPCNDAIKLGIRNCRVALYNTLLAEAKKLSESGHTNEAYNKFNEAKNYALKYSSDNISDKSAETQTERILKYNDYKDAVALALSSIENNDLGTAIGYFETAHDLESKYAFSPSIIPLGKEQQAARGLLKQKLNSLNDLVGKNDWEGLKQQLGSIKEMQTFYKLDSDNELNIQKADFTEKLKQHTCQSAMSKFEELFTKAQEYAKAKNYILALEQLEKALQIRKENPDCNINTSQADNEKIRLTPPATYQRFINQIIDMQAKGSYKDLTLKYKEAMAYYSQYDLDKFSILKKSFYDFALDNFKNSALAFIANEYRKNGQLDESFQIFKIAIERKYQLRYINSDLFELGKSIGLRDKAAGISNYKEKVSEYTKNEKSLKYFKNGYTSVF